ncbi:uncharacterized protein LOC129720417 [Wyeomyia smithii]|uniref:uncharacterized protein LOC129720417 n=1 Tax=Wyeomyia smithii TaxID=174621 RepID=UPI002467D901|nr:uncharacterized protein LOC129720417 [Wyeomyia smithii]
MILKIAQLSQQMAAQQQQRSNAEPSSAISRSNNYVKHTSLSQSRYAHLAILLQASHAVQNRGSENPDRSSCVQFFYISTLIRYDCPGITQHDKTKCYFNGKTYELDVQIPDELVSPFHLEQCYCRSASPFTLFRCSHVNNKPNSYCSTEKDCGDDRNKYVKCVLNGEEYFGGQHMYPRSDKCQTCICHEGFSEANIASDPHCYESTCGFELSKFAKHAYNGGSPVYFEDECCPWEWTMPKESDKLAETTHRQQSDDPLWQCKYGKLIMNIGDTLVPEVSDGFTYRCTCTISPLAHCTKSRNVPP